MYKTIQNTPASDHFWKLRCRKSARSRAAKHISKSKVQKTDGYGALLDVQMCLRVAGARDCAPSQKWAKREGFVASPKTMAGVGHLKRICKDVFRVAGAVQKIKKDMFIRDVRRSGRWFPERGCILEHQICRFAKMILRDRCSTSYDLASIFRGRRSTLDRWSGKIAKRIGTRRQRCTQLSIFEGSLAELLCFWCCQIQKLKRSRRIASFWMLLSSENEEVSQNFCVFDVVNFDINEEVSHNSLVFKLADREVDR